jgi:hypothetical protein
MVDSVDDVVAYANLCDDGASGRRWSSITNPVLSLTLQIQQTNAQATPSYCRGVHCVPNTMCKTSDMNQQFRR